MLIHMWEAVESHITCKAFQLGDPTANRCCGNDGLSPAQHLDIYVVISTSQDRMLVMFLISFWLETQHQPVLRISKVRKVSTFWPETFFLFSHLILYFIVSYKTIRYGMIRYDAVQYNMMQYHMIWHDAIWSNMMQCNTIGYNMIRCLTIL